MWHGRARTGPGRGKGPAESLDNVLVGSIRDNAALGGIGGNSPWVRLGVCHAKGNIPLSLGAG